MGWGGSPFLLRHHLEFVHITSAHIQRARIDVTWPHFNAKEATPISKLMYHTSSGLQASFIAYLCKGGWEMQSLLDGHVPNEIQGRKKVKMDMRDN